jgi:hypothetical protein
MEACGIMYGAILFPAQRLMLCGKGLLPDSLTDLPHSLDLDKEGNVDIQDYHGRTGAKDSFAFETFILRSSM